MQQVIIQNKIYEIRGHKVMLDFDLAALYNVEGSADFQNDNSSQFVMSSGKGNRNRGKKYLPYAFTEHGVTMLASVLKSDTARKMNIAIVRAFISMRKMVIQYSEVVKVINELKEKVEGHDAQLNQIYDALENMLDKKAEEENKQKQWEERKRIGFKN